MTTNKQPLNLNFEDYKQEGLYLIFPDSSRMILTKEYIEKISNVYWNDPNKIPEHVKEATDFLRCKNCPLRKEGGICNALRPILPFLEIIDKYTSIDEVVAIYKEKNAEVLNVADSTMQVALKYLSILSLFFYCEAGQKYSKFFWGITPLSGAKDIAMRFFLNVYWFHKGNLEEINKFISKYREIVTTTTQNQTKRLRLICKNDAFLNAYVSTHISSEFLTMDIDKMIQTSLDEFGTNGQ